MILYDLLSLQIEVHVVPYGSKLNDIRVIGVHCGRHVFNACRSYELKQQETWFEEKCS
jgi:hypothetical protein